MYNNIMLQYTPSVRGIFVKKRFRHNTGPFSDRLTRGPRRISQNAQV